MVHTRCTIWYALQTKKILNGSLSHSWSHIMKNAYWYNFLSFEDLHTLMDYNEQIIAVFHMQGESFWLAKDNGLCS